VVGRQLVPLLAARGDEVVVLARRAREVSGARVVEADALDADAISRAVGEARPDAVVDLLTAIPPRLDPRRVDRDLAPTNELRTVGASNLVAAARAAGVERLVGESIAFAYDPSGPRVCSEDDALWRSPPSRFRAAMEAVVAHERLLLDAGGTVLRFGHLYGPDTAFASDGMVGEQLRARRFPVVGGGAAMFSFVHTRDAASAVVAALDAGAAAAPAVFNVVDDDPVPLHDWVPAYASMLGARRPMRVPAWLARPAAGSYGVAYMTELRGASNARASEALGWRPELASWREGFAAELRA
jgi:nucleoside-diphosphate-sugar epimerase